MRMRVIQSLGWGLLVVGGSFFLLQFVFAFCCERPIVTSNLVLHLLPYGVMILGIAVLWRNAHLSRVKKGRATWLVYLVAGGIGAAGATFIVIYLLAMLLGGARASLLVADSMFIIIGGAALFYLPVLARWMR